MCRKNITNLQWRWILRFGNCTVVDCYHGGQLLGKAAQVLFQLCNKYTYVRFSQRGHICHDPTQCDLVLGIDLDAMSYFHIFSFSSKSFQVNKITDLVMKLEITFTQLRKCTASSCTVSKQYMGFEEMQKRRKRELVCFSLVFFWLNFFSFCEKGANICQIFLSLQK